MRSLGKYLIFIYNLFVRRESFKTYIKLIFEECIKVGYDSLFVVLIVSIFMGAVTTIQTAYNLISPFIPDPIIALVVRDMTLLALAPTVIAIVYAGKVGSNIAGELGTMRITEQIDALEVMGINATSFLVLPKTVASVIMFPMLVTISAFTSIFAGYWTARITGVISGSDYLTGIQLDFNQFGVTFALIKAVVYGYLVATISAYKGFFTQGGALEVGQSSTNAVTSSCIAILVADYFLAYMFAEFLTTGF